jgi:hypothetical protein
MTESEQRAWEQERSQGRDKFILRGLVRRGIPYAFGFAISNFAYDRFYRHSPSAWPDVWNCVATFLVMTLIGGWCDGARIWYRTERDYRQKSAAS